MAGRKFHFSPFFPVDRSRREVLLGTTNADLAVARSFDQQHPVFCLCKRKPLPLANYLASNSRKFDRWHSTLSVVEIPFDDEAEAFENINTRDELARFERP